MSDNELDELISQLKDACKKNRHHSSHQTNFHTVLQKIDVFINRRQMKLLNHQKRLDDLQRDLLLSECESSRNRVALEKKDFEVHQLHQMLNKAEQTTQSIMNKYDNDVQILTKQLVNVQQEYERLHRTARETKSKNDVSAEIVRLRELNKMLEIDNQRLYTENDQLRQSSCEKAINSSQRSKQPRANQIMIESKIKTLENDIDFYKRRSEQQEIEIHQLRKELDTCRKTITPDEIDKLRLLLNNSEQQCHCLRLEFQRIQTEKEILKVRLLEQKLTDSPALNSKEIQNDDYEKFIRSELEINLDQANKLINYWKSHQQILEAKIRQLTNEINQLQKDTKTNNADVQIYEYNENILQAKREMNKLQMEITDQNTTIYNLYKKIECLEQALIISKQRMNAQLNEIDELRARKSVMIPPIILDGLSTDDEGQIRRSVDFNRNLCTSSPIKSADIHRYFRHSSLSVETRRQNHEHIQLDHQNIFSHE